MDLRALVSAEDVAESSAAMASSGVANFRAGFLTSSALVTHGRANARANARSKHAHRGDVFFKVFIGSPKGVRQKPDSSPSSPSPAAAPAGASTAAESAATAAGGSAVTGRARAAATA